MIVQIVFHLQTWNCFNYDFTDKSITQLKPIETWLRTNRN